MNFNEAFGVVMSYPDKSIRLDKATFVHSTHQIAEISKSCIDLYKEKYGKRITNQMHATKNELVKIAQKLQE